MWGRSSFSYAPGDSNGINREPSRDAVPSSWTVAAVASAKQSATLITGAIAIGTIWFLSRRK